MTSPTISSKISLPTDLQSKFQASIMEQNYFENLENVFDYWSTEEIEKINEKATAALDLQAFISDPDVRSAADASNKLQSEADNFTNSFKDSLKTVFQEPSPITILANIMPYGNQEADPANNEPFKLIRYNKIKESGVDFQKLFSDIYGQNYEGYSDIINKTNKKNLTRNSGLTKEFSILLQNLYENLLVYPKIQFNQLGLGSVTKLTDLFATYYASGNFNQNSFFTDFINGCGYNIYFPGGPKTYPVLKGLNSKDFYEMNYKNWFPSAGDEFSGSGIDSYGCFFKRRPILYPGTSQVQGTSNWRYQELITDKLTAASYPDLFKPTGYNNKIGNINLNNGSPQSVYTFDPNNEKITLFLFNRYIEKQNDPIKIFDINSSSGLSANSYSNKINQIYYNFNNPYVKPNPPSSYYLTLPVPGTQPTLGAKPKCEINFSTNISNTPYYYIEANPITTTDKVLDVKKQTGGKKKKMRGGSRSNLFEENPSEPSLIVKRLNKEFNKTNFDSILNEFKNFDYSKIEDIYKNQLESLPLFYDNLIDWRETTGTAGSAGPAYLSYKDLRSILFFSNVLSNCFKLVTHFFENILASLNFIKTQKLVSLKSTLNKAAISGNVKEANAQSYQKYSDLANKGITELIKNIQRAISILKMITTDADLPAKATTAPTDTNQIRINDSLPTTKGQTVKDLFLGLNIPFLKALTGESLDVIVKNYVFYNGSDFSKDKFVNLIRKISTFVDPENSNSPVAFGGLSIVSIEKLLSINEQAWNAYVFNIKLRKISCENFYEAYTTKINDVMTNIPDQRKQQIMDEMNQYLTQLGGRQDLRAIFAPQANGKVKLSFINEILNRFYTILQKNLNDSLILTTSTSRNANTNPVRKLVQQSLGTSKDIYSTSTVEAYKRYGNFKYQVEAIILLLRQLMTPPTGNPELSYRSRQLWKWTSMKLKLGVSIMEYYLSQNIRSNKNLNSMKNKFKNFGVQIASNGNKMKIDPQYLKSKSVINPNYKDDEWWYKKYYDFQKFNPSNVNKVFIFSAIIDNATKDVKFYLIDLFAAAFSKDLSVAVANSIKLDNQAGNEIWAQENIITRIGPEALLLGFRGFRPEKWKDIAKQVGQKISSSYYGIKDRFAKIQQSLGIQGAPGINPELLASSFRNRQFAQQKQLASSSVQQVVGFLDQYYPNIYQPINKLIKKKLLCNQPILSVFEETKKFDNPIQLSDFFLVSDDYNNILKNLVLPFSGKGAANYPIFIMQPDVLTNITSFRKWAYQLFFSLPDLTQKAKSDFYTKYVITLDQLEKFPVKEEVPGLFGANVMFIKNIYSQLLANASPIKTAAGTLNMNKTSKSILANGLITQEVIQDALLI